MHVLTSCLSEAVVCVGVFERDVKRLIGEVLIRPFASLPDSQSAFTEPRSQSEPDRGPEVKRHIITSYYPCIYADVMCFVQYLLSSRRALELMAQANLLRKNQTVKIRL